MTAKKPPRVIHVVIDARTGHPLLCGMGTLADAKDMKERGERIVRYVLSRAARLRRKPARKAGKKGR